MPRDAFNQRASALENEFFHRVDQELILRLKKQHELKQDQLALAAATGIEDQKILDELTSVQITPRTLLAFSLFPSIHVAWSCGHIERSEREAVLRAAKNIGVVPDSPAYDLLQLWLRRKPSPELFQAWRDFICASGNLMSAAAFRELHSGAIKRAREIAEVAGGFLGVHNVSRAEVLAIEELESVFRDAATNASVSSAS